MLSGAKSITNPSAKVFFALITVLAILSLIFVIFP
nr:MAG TPA: hypothetical protein [Caudoviricetes sp.]